MEGALMKKLIVLIALAGFCARGLPHQFAKAARSVARRHGSCLSQVVLMVFFG